MLEYEAILVKKSVEPPPPRFRLESTFFLDEGETILERLFLSDIAEK
jgi:hypothetical protein